MSAMAIAEQIPIRHPEDLALPLLPQLEQVFAAVTPEGAKQFAKEILEAMSISKGTNDLRPVQNVVEAWYRTLLFVQEDGYIEALAEAAEINENSPKFTAEQLIKELDL